MNAQPMTKRSVIYGLTALLFAAMPLIAGGLGDNAQSDAVSSVGLAILAATVLAFAGHLLKQPLLLAYIAGGVVIGPHIGLGLVKDMADIEIISHFGLILLLFLIGLEIDARKLKESGKSLVVSGLSQFPISVILGLGFLSLLGYSLRGGTYDVFYLAACCAMSSTAIVVKLLYGKFELDTLAGRITLGILVFQDIWAIVLLGIQPNLTNPDILTILFSFFKGILLVLGSMLVSKYVLPRAFKTVAKVPELILVSSLGWCFLVCGAASYLNLSVEMGALIAGVAISTFPYNTDVIAKVVNIRDFFVTLFFVSLGMQIPNPLENVQVLVTAGLLSAFLVASRFFAVFPVLYALNNGIRVSLLTSINLSQISEFSLVIATLGLAAGHISRDTLTAIVFVFVMTSVLSTYAIKYNDAIQKALGALLRKCGLRDIRSAGLEPPDTARKDIALLGFHRTASALLHEILEFDRNKRPHQRMIDKIVVIDFNPETHESLQSLGVKVIYGDVSHLDTLKHSGIQDVKIVVSTIPDKILVGTDNVKLIKLITTVCPHAKIIVTAESSQRALQMYKEGADYVLLPHHLVASNLIETLTMMLKKEHNEMAAIVKRELRLLEERNEILRS